MAANRASTAPPPRAGVLAGAALAAALAAWALAAWPAAPAAVRVLVALAVAAAVVGAHALLGRARGAPAPTPNLLAGQLRVAAREAELARMLRFARDAPIGIAFFPRARGAAFANAEYLRIVGRTREALAAERYGERHEGLPAWLEPEQEARHEAEVVRDDGSRVPVMVALSRQAEGVAAFLVDLSAEKAAQRARDETEARLRAAAEELQEASRRKDEFLGMLSHELRNPLAPIRNSVYLLRRGAAEVPARRDRALEMMERQVDHLTRLVDDLLDATRITRGKIELRRERLDLAELLRKTIEDHQVLAQAAGVTLSPEVALGPVVVEGDRTRLTQVVGNLLQNAIKFSARGGAVRVSLQVGPERVAAVRVSDDGAGIEPEALRHLFEPFFQVERTLARSGGGLGLGLALVKALTERHGGTVTARSDGAGRGAEFELRLPLAAGAE